MNQLSTKIILYYLLAIIIGYSILGFGIISAFKNYFYSENNKVMLNQAIEIAELYKYSNSDLKISKKEYLSRMYLLDEYSRYDFFVTDNKFNVILKSEDSLNININDSIKFDKINDVLLGKIIFSSDKFDNKFNEDIYYVAYPITNDDGSINAIAFVVVSLSSLYASITKIYVLFIILAIIATLIGLSIIYFSVSKILSNIYKINNAAKKIAAGEFNEEIDIKGHDEISELAVSFNEMSHSLSKAEEYKNEFLSNIAHDIRSPITSIRGFIDAILDGTIPEDKIYKYLNIIKQETDRLNKLTNSILTLNKASNSSDSLLLTDFNINKLIESTIESMDSRILKKNIKIENQFKNNDIIVSADYEKIQRVLYNLFDNAVKFTNINGYIKTDVFTQEEKVHISITNSGEGLQKDECKKVFERLYKKDSSRGEDKIGLGLGLSIVKHFINIHNETITVESQPGEYTTFTFTLKLKNI